MHRLSHIDPDTRTAVCEVCGPTTLNKKGAGRWRCANVGKAAPRADWHRISALDTEALTGLCSLCGPVPVATRGKRGGYRCAKQVHEYKRTKEPKPLTDVQRERVRIRKLRDKYGIDEAQYRSMFEAQGEVCAICKLPETCDIRALAVDHCHDTGTVRGLLCNRCNQGLGLFQDCLDRVTAAKLYLETNGAPTVK